MSKSESRRVEKLREESFGAKRDDVCIFVSGHKKKEPRRTHTNNHDMTAGVTLTTTRHVRGEHFSLSLDELFTYMRVYFAALALS